MASRLQSGVEEPPSVLTHPLPATYVVQELLHPWRSPSVLGKGGHNSLPATLDAGATAVKYSRACGKPRTALANSCHVRRD